MLELAWIANRMRDRYSLRSAFDGSTLAARRAGSALAATTTLAIPSKASR